MKRSPQRSAETAGLLNFLPPPCCGAQICPSKLSAAWSRECALLANDRLHRIAHRREALGLQVSRVAVLICAGSWRDCPWKLVSCFCPSMKGTRQAQGVLRPAQRTCWCQMLCAHQSAASAQACRHSPALPHAAGCTEHSVSAALHLLSSMLLLAGWLAGWLACPLARPLQAASAVQASTPETQFMHASGLCTMCIEVGILPALKHRCSLMGRLPSLAGSRMQQKSCQRSAGCFRRWTWILSTQSSD